MKDDDFDLSEATQTLAALKSERQRDILVVYFLMFLFILGSIFLIRHDHLNTLTSELLSDTPLFIATVAFFFLFRNQFLFRKSKDELFLERVIQDYSSDKRGMYS